MARGPGIGFASLDSLYHMEHSVYMILHLYIFLQMKVYALIMTSRGGPWSPLSVHSSGGMGLSQTICSPLCWVFTHLFFLYYHPDFYVFDICCFLFLAIWTKSFLLFQ